MNQIPLILLTGFLGSGKTTLLNTLLKKPELADTAVVINEFGEVSLDHHFVESIAESTVVLNNGCICCTVRGELAGALHKLYQQRQGNTVPAFQRVVIETTGLADPAPILHEILSHPLMRQEYRLTGVITCVDAVLGMEQLDKEIEPLKQAAVADRILITKRELATPQALDNLTARLNTLNPAADILFSDNEALEPEWFLKTAIYDPTLKNADVAKWLTAEKYRQISSGKPETIRPASREVNRSYSETTRHNERIQSFCMTLNQPVQWNALLKALHMLVAMRGDHLLRLKGIVDVEGEERPRVIHCVQHLIFDTATLDRWPSGQKLTQLVFIVRDLNTAFIKMAFSHFIDGTTKSHTEIPSRSNTINAS